LTLIKGVSLVILSSNSIIESLSFSFSRPKRYSRVCYTS